MTSRMHTSLVLTAVLVTLAGCQNYPIVLKQTTEPGTRSSDHRSAHRGRWLFKNGVGVGTPTAISDLLPPETATDPAVAAPTYAPLVSDPLPGSSATPEILPASNTFDPAPVTTLPVADGSGSRSHTVQKGDTLWSISRQFYGSGARWKDIASANPGINPKRLKIGQSIVIP